MKKFLASLGLLLMFLLAATAFGNQQLQPRLNILNVASPAGIVSQPYIVRTFVAPINNNELKIGLEGHLELFGLNFSIGTFTKYPDFSFDEEIYVGYGLRIGGLYAALNATAEDLSSITDFSALENPQVAFGIAASNRTSKLVFSWSRFEFSYIPEGLVYKENGQLKFEQNFDWTSAKIRLIIESQDIGYFLFAFYTGLISDLQNGDFRYAFEVALPVSPFYVYVSQDFEGNLKTGLGLALLGVNALGIYEVSTGNIYWVASAQF